MTEQNIVYSPEFEKLLKEESEKAECLSICHSFSHLKFNRLSTMVNIPVIILSSVVGFITPLKMFDEQTIMLGALSICISILKSIESYFDYTKRAENHRITSLSYFKISQFIRIQLSLTKDKRILAKDLYTMITNDLQNLKDREPIIDDGIINKFKEKYKHEEEKTARPSILNGLTSISITE